LTGLVTVAVPTVLRFLRRCGPYGAAVPTVSGGFMTEFSLKVSQTHLRGRRRCRGGGFMTIRGDEIALKPPPAVGRHQDVPPLWRADSPETLPAAHAYKTAITRSCRRDASDPHRRESM